MKTRLGYLLSFLPFSFSALPLFAHHLDGLWRNDRENISLRIETTDQGFKARRLDQGIWFFYTEDRDHVYVDRNGNYYEILDEDHIAWHDARVDKRIDFYRADTYGSNDQYANNEDN
ncbi:MAG TPA: hypothetical protein VJ508_06910, partial [Saprospiraceae bacterium]|nr:hypothetical protein [Saprospiraceae bacterium]